jgi:cell wall-associated NlpC family hydrolase
MSKRRVHIALTAVLLMVLLPAGCAPGGRKQSTGKVTSKPVAEPSQAGYWIAKLADANRVIMTPAQISSFNNIIRQKLPDQVFDLFAYPDVVGMAALKKMIDQPFPGKTLYLDGRPLSGAYLLALRQNMNISAIHSANQVQYALTVTRTSIRTHPTGDFSTDMPADRDFDRFQETALDPAEAVVVLRRSRDGLWSYVQAYNYRGWLPTTDLAFATRAEWLDYQQSQPYLVVTASHLSVGGVSVAMGKRLPLAVPGSVPKLVDGQVSAGKYVVRLPWRRSDGKLACKLALVGRSDDVAAGYLSYTRANILRQVFKMLGERYGWGGLFGTRDCSALTMDTYRSFGFTLPRNADQQECSAGQAVFFKGDRSKRYSQLQKLLTGATLHMPGHVLLYLGRDGDRYYVIHAIYSAGDVAHKNPDGTLGRLVINQVTVTDLDLPLRSGRLLIEALTSGKQIE